MPGCREIDPLVTPYVDGEATAAERVAVEAHLSACPACRQYAEAELSARDSLRARCRPPYAPERLRKRCVKAATPLGRITSGHSFVSLSAAAALIMMLGGVLLYGLTHLSATVLAAELTLDHVKCFALHGGTEPADVQATEDAFARNYGWRLHVPRASAAEGLQLLGVRRCFSGEGPAMHVMYRHRGEAVSLYVLRNVSHAAASTGVVGYDAIIWTAQGTTYVLLGRESSAVLQQLALDLK